MPLSRYIDGIDLAIEEGRIVCLEEYKPYGPHDQFGHLPEKISADDSFKKGFYSSNTRKLKAPVSALLSHWGKHIRSVCDLGAGTGVEVRQILKNCPQAKITTAALTPFNPYLLPRYTIVELQNKMEKRNIIQNSEKGKFSGDVLLDIQRQTFLQIFEMMDPAYIDQRITQYIGDIEETYPLIADQSYDIIYDRFGAAFYHEEYFTNCARLRSKTGIMIAAKDVAPACFRNGEREKHDYFVSLKNLHFLARPESPLGKACQKAGKKAVKHHYFSKKELFELVGICKRKDRKNT